MPKIDITNIAAIKINKSGKITDSQSKGLDVFYKNKYKGWQAINLIACIFFGIIWLSILLAQGIAYQQISVWLWLTGFFIVAGWFGIDNVLERKKLSVPNDVYRAWNKQIQSAMAICASRHGRNGVLEFFTDGTGERLTLTLPENTLFTKEDVAYRIYYIDDYLLSLEPVYEDKLFIKIYNARLMRVFNFKESDINSNANNELSRRQSIKALFLYPLLVLLIVIVVIAGFSFCLLSVLGVLCAIPFVFVFMYFAWMIYNSIRDGFRIKAYKGKAGWIHRRGLFSRHTSYYFVLVESKEELYAYPHQINGFVDGVYEIYYMQSSILSMRLLSH